MKKYYCVVCNKYYLECDLITTKCSENYVGSYIDDEYCPKCFKNIKLTKLIVKEED